MWLPLLTTAAVVSLGALALRHRRGYLRELPMHLWGRELPDARSAASELARLTGLSAEQAPPGLGWLGDFFLSPVWMFWGDLRTMRPERRLARWRLSGARSSGRQAAIRLGPDEAELEVGCTARGALWADLGRALEVQEGLRALHPVGGARWQRVAGHLRALAGEGVLRLRFDEGALRATISMDERGPAAEAYPGLLRELEALAASIER